VGFTGLAAFGFASTAMALPWVAAVVAGLALAWPGVPRRLYELATGGVASLMDGIFR
jgi:hypothetical protein